MSFNKEIETKDVYEAMEAAEHNFSVVKEKIYTDHGLLVPDHVAIVNQDTGQYLGTVGSGWEPVQPQTVYELANDLIESTNGKINGCFSMMNNAIMGISFQLAKKEYIEGDPIDLNFIMVNSFNGTHGVAGHSTTNRIACMNQANTSNRVYSLKHTKFVLNRIEIVKNILKFYENEIKNFDEKMMHLINTRMNDSEAIEWFKSLFPKPKSPTGETRIEKQVGIFIDCLMNGRGSHISGVRGTSYGAFQALTEYINHRKPVKIHNDRDEDEVKFQSIHFGAGNTLTQKALNSISSDTLGGFSANEFLID